ncbi:C40 family peptidase [Paenibacillus rhizophilus]|uniref:NlpC/P60 family protein n=1 Tax=Paenibacillus rhizophilus TaxID=1850366 RepID=A0A3N9PBT5_9BACL|nr:C40 family peptidase [Paenibacillus rhizophilus]RQW12484.1 NlpC/P60 family protein [Paenibacillus rhizophilus]
MKKVILSLIAAAAIFTSAAPSTYASEVKLESVVNQVLGTPYLYGGTTASGFDCSGFILYVLKKFNVDDLPRTSQSQARVGTPVSKEDLRVGDLVFFNTFGKGVSHAGIYIGDNQFAHSSSVRGVRVSKLSDAYYKDRYVTARRVVDEKSYSKMISE